MLHVIVFYNSSVALMAFYMVMCCRETSCSAFICTAK